MRQRWDEEAILPLGRPGKGDVAEHQVYVCVCVCLHFSVTALYLCVSICEGEEGEGFSVCVFSLVVCSTENKSACT